MAAGTDDRSIGSVLFTIAHNIQDIVHYELRLAKIELKEEGRKAKTAAVLLALGGGAAMFAALFALIAATLVLSVVVPHWAAALIVAGMMAVLGLVFIFSGRKRLQNVHPIPERTAENVKEDLRWTKPQMR